MQQLFQTDEDFYQGKQYFTAAPHFFSNISFFLFFSFFNVMERRNVPVMEWHNVLVI